MTPYLRNVIRTAVPAVIGAATAYLAKHGFNASNTVAMEIMPVATTAYYSLIRWAEERYPKFSWLIGALPVPPKVIINEVVREVLVHEAPVAKKTPVVKKATVAKKAAPKKTDPKA